MLIKQVSINASRVENGEPNTKSKKGGAYCGEDRPLIRLSIMAALSI